MSPVVHLTSKGAWRAACIQALDGRMKGDVAALEATVDVNGVATLRVDFGSYQAAETMLRRVLIDDEQGHTVSWKGYINHTGNWIRVTYAWTERDTYDIEGEK